MRLGLSSLSEIIYCEPKNGELSPRLPIQFTGRIGGPNVLLRFNWKFEAISEFGGCLFWGRWIYEYVVSFNLNAIYAHFFQKNIIVTNLKKINSNQTHLNDIRIMHIKESSLFYEIIQYLLLSCLFSRDKMG